MTEISPKLGLPYIQPSQAQKHVTHNEAIQGLDTLVQLRIVAFGADTPPDTPGIGDSHALGAVPGLAWAGQDGKIATWDGTAWQFLDPQEGWLAWDTTEAKIRVYTGGNWSIPDLSTDQVARVGIATAADDTNRLAVASQAVLLTHAGADHRVKVNKASDSDTASLLFQSNWTGHAEMGLAGDTAFSIKVSADGSSWTQVLRADPGTVQLDAPVTGTAVQSSAMDTTAGRLMRADYGYGPGNLLGAVSQSAGDPTGAVFEQGGNANGQYIRLADGTQICWNENFTTNSGGAATWTFPSGFSTVDVSPALSVTCRYTGGPRIVAAKNDGAGAFSAAVHSWDVSGSNAVAPEVSLMAIGRWY
ncbi:DUF2793 domain-containing protein (plasmid) [Rhodobacteraceae bacterium M382]|nr:DUF2793 domain-containing protein [Rhodobacteraceae bacterium M382]